MIKLGLIGHPLGHSLSPRIHQAALKSCGLEGSYSLFPLPPDDRQSLKELITRVRDGKIHGLNVTIPHKQNVIPLLDELTVCAKAIGAVNTISSLGNKVIGDNTDAPGFLSDLDKFLTTETQSHRELEALVLGAGGSARAVVYALVNKGWKVTLAARRRDQAQHLAASLTNDQFPIAVHNFSDLDTPSSPLQTLLSSLSLIVNTTPLGMAPNIDRSPWPENLPFPAQTAVYDLVYNPRETKLVKDACSQGLSATTGLGMLIEQAALSFEIWTGHPPPREAMFEAARQTVH